MRGYLPALLLCLCTGCQQGASGTGPQQAGPQPARESGEVAHLEKNGADTDKNPVKGTVVDGESVKGPPNAAAQGVHGGLGAGVQSGGAGSVPSVAGMVGDGTVKTGPDGRKCVDAFKQTGPGCDQAGIEATLKTLRRPGGAVARCYRSSLDGPRTGLIKFRLTLTPEGRVGQVEKLTDEFPGTLLAGCLESAVRGLQFPAPGDVPCVVVHTFPFVSEEKSK